MTHRDVIDPSPRELLSQDAVDWINESHGLCPDCDEGELVEGPKAAGSINAKCRGCGSEFWLGFHDKYVVTGGKLDRDEPTLYDFESEIRQRFS